jgi:hypothetical protein
MDKIASQIKVLLLFGMVGVNEVGIRWKDNALIRGGLTDASNSFFFLRKKRSKACREKSADAIVVQNSITLHEGQNLTIKR